MLFFTASLYLEPTTEESTTAALTTTTAGIQSYIFYRKMILCKICTKFRKQTFTSRLLLEPKYDANRVPTRASHGCPSGSYNYDSTCCCGQKCCWSYCQWDPPPDSCFGNLKDLFWIRNPSSGKWAPQISKLRNI